MRTNAQDLIKFFQNHGGVVRFSRILKAGFHSDTLGVLEKHGGVERIGRGLYRLTGHSPKTYPDLVAAFLQAPRGVICLLSALAFHEATSEIPRYVEIAIARGTHANRVKYPPVKFHQFAFQAWGSGVIAHAIEGRKIKVYCLAKTIADCFKFRNQIGVDVARDALKVALMEKNIPPVEIMRYAKICRVDSVIKPILEAIL